MCGCLGVRWQARLAARRVRTPRHPRRCSPNHTGLGSTIGARHVVAVLRCDRGAEAGRFTCLFDIIECKDCSGQSCAIFATLRHASTSRYLPVRVASSTVQPQNSRRANAAVRDEIQHRYWLALRSSHGSCGVQGHAVPAVPRGPAGVGPAISGTCVLGELEYRKFIVRRAN